MLNIKRRTVLGGVAGVGVAALAGTAAPLWAQTAKSAAAAAAAAAAVKGKAVARLAPKLRIVIPANAGGGWDQTGRALGAALVGSGATNEIEYENKGGKGGTLGLAYFAEKYGSDANTLLIGRHGDGGRGGAAKAGH